MENGKTPNETARGLVSQAASRKRPRAHAMDRRQKLVRRLGAQGEPSHHEPTSETSNESFRNGSLRHPNPPRIVNREVVSGVLSSMYWEEFNLPGYSSRAENRAPLKEAYMAQFATRVGHLNLPMALNLNPVSTLPFQINRRDQRLLHHFITVFGSTNMVVNSRADFLKMVVSDAALLHMTLVCSAHHYAVLCGKTFSADAVRHQREIVKVLSGRLVDPILSITDATILSISYFSLTEILTALPLGTAPHLRALEELVKRRGGLQALGLNGMVRRKVLWADLSCAISLQTPPRFPYHPEQISSTFPSDIIDIVFHALDACTCAREISSLAREFNFPSDLSKIVHDIEALSFVISSSNRSDIAEMDGLMLSDRFYDIERRTYDLFLAQHPTVTSPINISGQQTKTSYSLYTILTYTILIYVSQALREIPSGAGFFNALVSRLTSHLQVTNITTICAAYPRTLLWILGTGGVASRGRKQRGWYVKQLADFCQEMNILEWEVMRDVFGSPVHFAPEYIKAFRGFWDEAEEVGVLRGLD